MGKNELELIIPEKDVTERCTAVSVPQSPNFPVAFPEDNSRKELSISIDPKTTIITKALDTVNCISRCIAEVSIEKQRTKQVQAQSKAVIAAAKETTKQVYIQETEATKRVLAGYAAEVEKAKSELRKLERELKSVEKGHLLEHHKAMKILNTTVKTIEMFCEQSKQTFACIKESCSDDERQTYIDLINKINENIVKLNQEMYKLKGEIEI